jgi:hypothetical protein
LLSAARGEYVSQIDDDDEVAADYVSRIHRAIAKTRKEVPPADVICFGQRATLAPHGIVHECSYSLDHWRNRPPESRRQLAPKVDGNGQASPNTLLWTGPPAHTMVWRREMVADIRFPEQQFGEDVGWVDVACGRAKTEVQLGETLYHYKFDVDRSTTR